MQAIYDCDGHQGVDFIVSGEDIKEVFSYKVSYEWDNAPSSVNLPVDSNK